MLCAECNYAGLMAVGKSELGRLLGVRPVSAFGAGVGEAGGSDRDSGSPGSLPDPVLCMEATDAREVVACGRSTGVPGLR